MAKVQWENASESTLKFWRWVLLAYCLCGLYGALWISDEFDMLRLALVAFVGTPAIALFQALYHYVPYWGNRWPITHKFVLLAILIPFTWGNVICLNAVGQEKSEHVNFTPIARTMPVKVARGAFGLLYKKRW